MEYQATSKYIRVSTRKMRLIADAVRKLPVARAMVQLSMMPKTAAPLLAKVIKSAVANAGQKGANVDTLAIGQIEVMGGPAMKRFHAVSRGMAHAYKKRMTHVRVVLKTTEEKKAVKKAEAKGAK